MSLRERENYVMSNVISNDRYAIAEQHRLAGAVHIAKTELRLRAKGDDDGAEAAYGRLYAVLQQSRHPELLLNDLVRRLGRHKSLSLGIDRPIVDLALR
jgi:hypothetical protein